MKLYTIGFTRISFKKFWDLLEKNNISLVLDTRVNRKSQLASFAKVPEDSNGEYFEFLLKYVKNLNIKYLYSKECAPEENLFNDFKKKKKITWEEYEKKYNALLEERNIKELFPKKVDIEKETVCILCSEDTPENCHRRLLAEYLKKNLAVNIEIMHL